MIEKFSSYLMLDLAHQVRSFLPKICSATRATMERLCRKAICWATTSGAASFIPAARARIVADRSISPDAFAVAVLAFSRLAISKLS